MEQLYATAGFLIAASITPGPNNLIVLTAARKGGVRAALPVMLGVIGGSLALLALVWTGIRVVFELVPPLSSILAIMGAGYIGALGAMMIWRASGHREKDGSRRSAGLPTTALGLAMFQLLNPKSWVLVATATSITFGGSVGFLVLAVLLTVICAACLSVWATAGAVIAGVLKDERSHRWFDRAMGALLIASAALLLVGV